MKPEIQEYLDVVGGMDKAEGTIRIYRTGLEQFSDWVDSQDLEVDDVSPRDVQRYLTYLKNHEGYAPSTIRLRFTAISQFYKDRTNNGTDQDDPTDPVSIADYAPRTSKKEEVSKEKHIWITKDEVKELVENVPAPSLRNRLVILFQYYTGLRRQEVVDVKISDLDREEREVKVRGKNNTVHTAHWQPQLDGLLTAWLDGGYRDASPYARKSDYLFLTESTPQMNPGRVSYIVRTAAENAGLQEVLYEDAAGKPQHKITSHTLRHSFAMAFLQDGGSIDALSNLMAHSSVTTTEIYGEILDERAKEEYEEYAPQIDI